MSDHRTVPVPDGLAGERVDVGLARMFGLSRTKASELVMAGDVLLDGAMPSRSTRLEPGMWLSVTLPAPKEPVRVQPMIAPGMRLVHEDDDIVVVDKPVGVAAHPSEGWDGPTVLGHLAAAGVRIEPSGPPERHGIVSRLDVGTSGLMVVAKSARAYPVLKASFAERRVDKIYHALAQGRLDPAEGTIDAAIGRSPNHDYKFAVMSTGKHAITHYSTLEELPGATLVRVKLETGRTHQIRVHMAALKHPLAGDPLYGADPVLAERLVLIRQWLHAMELSFVHPSSGERVTYASQHPDDLAHALEVLRGG